MTATDTPIEVAVVHVTSTPTTVRRFGGLDNWHTPTCCVCGPLGVPMHVEDARDVGRNHVRAVAVVAVVDDDGDEL